MVLANHDVGGPTFIINHLVRAQKEKKKTSSSTKHQVGRLKVMNQLIESGMLQGGDLKQAAEYSIQGYKNSHQEIRKEAYTCIMNLYRQMGEKLKSYLTDIRKAQIEMLQEGFDELDGVDPKEKQAQAPASAAPTITTNIDPNGAKSSPKKKKQQTDPDKTCAYCGKFDDNFDENSLDLHCFQECPMLTECPGCSQMVEIPDLQYHLQEECDNAHAFKTCPRCREPVDAGNYDQHVDEELCNPY